MAHLFPKTSTFDDLHIQDTNIEQQQPFATNRIASVPSSPTLIQEAEQEYQPRTLGAHNRARRSLLPVFPSLSPSSLSSPMPHLLLTNVPVNSLTEKQFARLQYHAFSSLFRLETHAGVQLNLDKNPWNTSCPSFLLGLYQQLYIKMKKRLKIDIPIIDCNFVQLYHCISKVVAQRSRYHHHHHHHETVPPPQTMLTMDELPLALEFYLQFDVDMFYLKTCSFHGVKPRLFEHHLREGVFCIDAPEARFSIAPCHRKHCDCCQPYSNDNPQRQRTSIPFSSPHIHRFVNQYEAILNCPAICQTKNCIYVLTCPCGQFDYVGLSKLSFAETLARHRKEGNRILREFLIGEQNIHLITHGLKSAEKNPNDKMWLYQHSTRCSIALQIFLDDNPDYWCFVPMKRLHINLLNQTSLSCTASLEHSPSSLSRYLRTRSDDEVHLLIDNLPLPPLGFDFSIQQRQQQIQFFKLFQDYMVPRDPVDLYNADIIAVLPDHCSELFGQVIESLFITHAECKLNQMGHLVYEYSDPNHGLYSSWCANLTRRPV